MKLSLDPSMLHLTHERITNFSFLCDFDKKSIRCLPSICKNSIPIIEADASNNIEAKATFAGAHTSSILVSRLITSVNAEKHYSSIARVTNHLNMSYSTALATFKIEHEAFLSVKDETEPKVPNINERDNDLKIICWSPIFKEFLASSHDSCSPLIHSLRKDPVVPDEIMHPPLSN